MTYNYVNAALSTLIPICEEKFIVKESDIWTDIDFTADKTKVDVELCATIRLAQVMHMLIAIAFGALGVLIQNSAGSAVRKAGHRVRRHRGRCGA